MNKEISAQLFAESKTLFPGGVNSPVRSFAAVGGKPFFVKRGEGAYLIDEDNNRYCDFVCSWGPLVLGHAPPQVIESLINQAWLGTSYGTPTRLESELAKVIKKLYPSIELLRFVNSGTEAALSVVRLVRGFTKRRKLIKFSGCYHGHVDALMVSAGSGIATLNLPTSPGVTENVVQDTIVLEFNDNEGVEKAFKEHGSDIGAVLLEPICGNAGFILPKLNFLSFLREITKEYEALLVFDEVMTGFRVSLGGASLRYGINPDLTLFGKVIGGGLPVGAYGGRADIMSMIAPSGSIYQAGTLSGNPLAVQAGLTTLQVWSEGDLFVKTESVAAELCKTLLDCANFRGIPIQVNFAGSMFGFFFCENPITSFAETKYINKERFVNFFNLLLERGVYIAPSPFEAGFVSAAHIGEPIERACEAIEDAFKYLK
jgi:glutamate-1-semialdehyde 2,1-aminomutase